MITGKRGKDRRSGFRYKRGKISSGERKIIRFLRDNNIKYLREITFKNLINPMTGNHLYFDFYIPKFKVIIEVQGDQHFKFVPDFHKDLQHFEYQQLKDQFKREYCIKHHYNLIAIPYTQIDDLVFLLEVLK